MYATHSLPVGVLSYITGYSFPPLPKDTVRILRTIIQRCTCKNINQIVLYFPLFVRQEGAVLVMVVVVVCVQGVMAGSRTLTSKRRVTV